MSYNDGSHSNEIIGMNIKKFEAYSIGRNSCGIFITSNKKMYSYQIKASSQMLNTRHLMDDVINISTVKLSSKNDIKYITKTGECYEFISKQYDKYGVIIDFETKKMGNNIKICIGDYICDNNNTLYKIFKNQPNKLLENNIIKLDQSLSNIHYIDENNNVNILSYSNNIKNTVKKMSGFFRRYSLIDIVHYKVNTDPLYLVNTIPYNS